MRNEIWRSVVDYEGLYEVSNQGRIRSLLSDNRRILKQNPDTYGYMGVNLCKSGVKKHYTHVMVASAFLGPRPKGKQVCHGPAGIKINIVKNLSYGSSSENGLDRRRDGTAGCRVLRSDGIVFTNARAASEYMNKNHGAIYHACNGTYDSAYGFTWSYIGEADADK